jgi:hypothetical protein
MPVPTTNNSLVIRVLQLTCLRRRSRRRATHVHYQRSHDGQHVSITASNGRWWRRIMDVSETFSPCLVLPSMSH